MEENILKNTLNTYLKVESSFIERFNALEDENKILKDKINVLEGQYKDIITLLHTLIQIKTPPKYNLKKELLILLLFV